MLHFQQKCGIDIEIWLQNVSKCAKNIAHLAKMLDFQQKCCINIEIWLQNVSKCARNIAHSANWVNHFKLSLGLETVNW